MRAGSVCVVCFSRYGRPAAAGFSFIHTSVGFEAPGAPRRIVRRHQHIAPADIDLFLQAHRHGHRRECLGQFAIARHERPHARFPAGRQHQHRIAGANRARSQLSRESAEILVGADDVLHRQAQSHAWSSAAIGTVSRCSSSAGPRYQGMRGSGAPRYRRTSALSGMNCRSGGLPSGRQIGSKSPQMARNTLFAGNPPGPSC